MSKPNNDATLQQAGIIYQYIIALKDCFELNDTDILYIETYGDVSIINNTEGLFQKEVKHHFSDVHLSERDDDFWKTLANWYTEYDRVKSFTHLILYTTAIVDFSSPFYEWNNLKKEEKLNLIINIGEKLKEKEKTFRKQYNRIFNAAYDEKILLEILGKFFIESSQTSLAGISKEFSKYLRPIPEENRDNYIGALLGRILEKIIDPPHKWEVSKKEFDEMCQAEAVAYGMKGCTPLPKEYAKATVPEECVKRLEQKRFVEALREIEYTSQIIYAVSDYWKTDMTIVKYFRNNIMYLESLDDYKLELSNKMDYTKSNSEIDASGVDIKDKVNISKRLYNDVMQWDARDFGSIICNQGYFQRGIIHNIVDETDFKWKVGEEEDEHK